jgi:hypothetical protein
MKKMIKGHERQEGQDIMERPHNQSLNRMRDTGCFFR